MSNPFKQAPELMFTASKQSSSKGMTYYGWKIEIYDYINSHLSGREGNCIKLMNVLLGTAAGFRVSQKWICERCGFSKDAYYKARKKLEEKKMLIYDEKENVLLIDTKGMLEKYSKEKEKNEGMFETYSKSISETYSEGMHEKYSEGISETYHNKKETKEITEKNEQKSEAFSAKAEKSPHPIARVSKEDRDRLLKQTKSTGWGEEMDKWLNEKGNVVFTPKDWLGF